MATFRVGVGSFNIEDKGVGFGTSPTDGLGNLKVKGVTKTTGSIVSGASTLTRYSGFAADNINQLENITLTSEVGTIGDIVVGVGTSVIISSGSTVTVGTVESVSIGTHFSPPVGGIEERGQDFIEGMMRFNTDLNTMEFYNGNEWRQFTYISDIKNSPSSRGRSVHAGGANPVGGSFLPDMSHFEHATSGVGLAFGDLTVGGQGLGGFSSSTRGLFSGRRTPSTNPDNIIDYITIASAGDAIDFGDMTDQRRLGATLSSSTRGIMAGGITPSRVNIIDYVEMSTIGNAIDFGDTTELFASMNGGGISNGTRGVYNSGESPSAVSGNIQFITISSKGNSVKFGELNVKRRACGMCSNNTRGLFAAGYNGGASTNRIEFITISSTGNGTDFGELARPPLTYTQGSASQTRGFFSGGYFSPAITASIDVISIAEGGNATDFGDLAFATESGAACSDSHGGLGGY